MSVLSDVWLVSEEAAKLLSEVNGREIKKNYVRVLARRNHIQSQALTKRTSVYYAPDCRKCKVKPYAHKKRQS